MGQITAWSYSRWSDYDRCPRLAKFKYIEKIKEPANAAMERGSAAHDTLAAYIRGDIPREVPNTPAAVPGWTYFADLLNQLRELEPLVEQEWGYTRTWGPTGWMGRDVWFRCKLDAALVYDDHTADVIDFKTGKPSPTHADQAELYALSVVHRYPHVQHVTVRFWYVDTDHKGAERVYRFEVDMLAELLERWTRRAERMLNDTLFVPKPGRHCSWCYQAKSKGGGCKYG